MSTTNNNSQDLTKDGFSHNGRMLDTYIKSHGVSRVNLSKRLGQCSTSIFKQLKSESLQLKVLWNLSIVLKHNFIGELAAQLPADVVDPIKSAREKELEKELEEVKLELSIYKNIVGK